MWKSSLLFCLLFFVASCGGASLPEDVYDVSVPTQSPPYVSRIDPANGAAGTTVTIYGLGFSTEAANNIILLGDTSTIAQTYSLVPNPVEGEIEILTFAVPADAVAGEAAVSVMVFENVSNGDVVFTVTE